MSKISTSYSSYQELLLDLDIFGNIIKAPPIDKDEYRKLLFEEYKHTHHKVSLEDRRYELSDLVSSDFHVKYTSEIELQENEELVDIGTSSNEDYSRISDMESLEVPQEIKGYFSLDKKITDEDRLQLLQILDYFKETEDINEFVGSVDNVESNFGTVVENTSNIYDDSEIENTSDYEENNVEDEEDYYEEDEYASDDSNDDDEDSDDYESDDDDYYNDEEDDVEEDDYTDEDDSDEYIDDEECYSDDEEDDDDFDEYTDEEEEYTDEDNEEEYTDDEEEYVDDDYTDEEDSDDYTDEEDSDDYTDDDSEDYVVEEDEYSAEEIKNEGYNSDSTESNKENDTDEPSFIDSVFSNSNDIIDFISEDKNRKVDVPKVPIKEVKKNQDCEKEVINRDSEPKTLREFLRKHPHSEVSYVLKYFSKKEVQKEIMMGTVIKKGNKLHI